VTRYRKQYESTAESEFEPVAAGRVNSFPVPVSAPKTGPRAQQRSMKQTEIRKFSGTTLKPSKTHGFRSNL
jgi:hypothetical protein